MPTQPKAASSFTTRVNHAAASRYDLDNRQDFVDAQRGFIAPIRDGVVLSSDGAALYDESDYAFLSGDSDSPDTVNPSMPAATDEGDVEAALHAAEVVVDQTYRTAFEHNNPLEPHAASARWDGDTLTLVDSTQGVHPVAQTLAPLLGVEQDRLRVLAPYVGGGFGSKGVPHAPEMMIALAARRLM